MHMRNAEIYFACRWPITVFVFVFCMPSRGLSICSVFMECCSMECLATQVYLRARTSGTSSCLLYLETSALLNSETNSWGSMLRKVPVEENRFRKNLETHCIDALNRSMGCWYFLVRCPWIQKYEIWSCFPPPGCAWVSHFIIFACDVCIKAWVCQACTCFRPAYNTGECTSYSAKKSALCTQNQREAQRRGSFLGA